MSLKSDFITIANVLSKDNFYCNLQDVVLLVAIGALQYIINNVISLEYSQKNWNVS